MSLLKHARKVGIDPERFVEVDGRECSILSGTSVKEVAQNFLSHGTPEPPKPKLCPNCQGTLDEPRHGCMSRRHFKDREVFGNAFVEPRHGSADTAAIEAEVKIEPIHGKIPVAPTIRWEPLRWELLSESEGAWNGRVSIHVSPDPDSDNAPWMDSDNAYALAAGPGDEAVTAPCGPVDTEIEIKLSQPLQRDGRPLVVPHPIEKLSLSISLAADSRVLDEGAELETRAGPAS